MGRDLNIIPYRFTFVEKTLSQVGTGTDWNILVTSDELAEIAYRVRQASVVDGGSATYTFTVDGDDFVCSFAGSPIDPPSSPLANDLGSNGYSALVPSYLSYSPPAEYAAYFSSSYTVNFPFETYHVWDILHDELGLWLPDIEVGDGYKFPGFNATGGLRTGLSFDSYDSSSWVFDFPDSGPSGGAGLNFNSYVAFVDLTGSGDPFDAGNPLYIGCFFDAVPFDGSISFRISSRSDLGVNYEVVGSLSLDILLSASVLTVPLYCVVDTTDIPTGGTFSASNIVIAAREWWPYAKPDGTPQWDTSTGLKL